MKKSSHIWKNGQLIPWEEAQTHVLTHALHYGSGVFEGIRAYETDRGPAIFKAKEHYERLHYSANCYHFEVPYSVDELIEHTRDLIKKSELSSCYIRPLVYFGYDQMGILPYNNPIDTIIAVWGWGTYLGDEALENGIRCKISKYTKFNANMIPPTAKCSANYANSILAKKDVIDQGYDEAILLNVKGTIAEGPGENIFVIKDGKVKTTPIEDDVLDGITCQTVVQLCQDLGFEVSKESITKEELFNADEAFFTGTAAEVTPIREVDDIAIGIGRPGPITKQIQALYFDIIKGKNAAYSDWLTYC